MLIAPQRGIPLRMDPRIFRLADVSSAVRKIGSDPIFRHAESFPLCEIVDMSGLQAGDVVIDSRK
jgi:hypothetical protein